MTVQERSGSAVADPPETGQLARVRGRMWVVGDVVRDAQASADGRPVQHLVNLVSVEDDATGEELRVVWELEPGTRVIERAELPQIAPDRFDEPGELAAFLDAVRWGAIASADQRSLQAPFRSGITIEDYQLEPLVRALRMPRTTLLIADDVGLGKTIEAGLVVQELLLRHRARTVLVVCPASLQRQWRDELQDKFGLEFRIVDRTLLGELRRSRGVGANPFAHFPRLIVSVDWLKGELGMRLLREVLPAHPEIPRRYDVLIVDEVHNCAPAGTGGGYARDTLRTQAIRTLAAHCEHRLFLSATPHNGYDNSFAALLELLDPHRFARAILPPRDAIQQVTVRRLKSELVDADGTPRFASRRIVPLTVEHPEDERAVHADLVAYGRLRAQRLSGDRAGEHAADFIVTLLKKRLFSSPAAFLRTLEVHRRTLLRDRRPERPPTPTLLRRLIDDIEDSLDDERSEDGGDATETALDASSAAESTRPGEDELALLDSMINWASRAAVTEDARTTRLLDWVQESIAPEGQVGENRVIVFSEYRATQRYLQERLSARGIAGERVALLDGTTDEDERELIKHRWQEPPGEHPVRVLLATDAASEGISLQKHCSRLAHAEIPWNPNRLEQRNGRIDRHGQSAREVLIHHCVSAGWEHASRGSLEGDLDFLARVVEKVQQIRLDLGSAGPVIAAQIEAAMLGRRATLDDRELVRQSSTARTVLAEERRMRERLASLRDELQKSREDLRLEPERVRRVVDTALRLAGQSALLPGTEAGTFVVPALTGSWAHAVVGLEHPLHRDRVRPITFDEAIHRGRSDLVLVHVGHPLVQRALRLMRAEVWGTGHHLHRVAVRYAEPTLRRPHAVVYGRLVITGASGHRLHEQLIHAVLALEADRPRRLGVQDGELAIALGLDRTAPTALARRAADTLQAVRDPLRAALQARAAERARQLTTTLSRRDAEERDHVAATLTELRDTIRGAIGESADQQTLFNDVELNADGRVQAERDLTSLRTRLTQIPDDIAREQAAITRRYANPTHRLFPAAVELLLPEEVRL
jgi:superfamily II DNA or RNA helicase